MNVHSIFYWVGVVLGLYAAYLLCFCMFKIHRGKKTNERICVPRILYLLTAIASFVPILNFIFGVVVMVESVMAYYINEDFYFKSWLTDCPKKKGD